MVNNWQWNVFIIIVISYEFTNIIIPVYYTFYIGRQKILTLKATR